MKKASVFFTSLVLVCAMFLSLIPCASAAHTARLPQTPGSEKAFDDEDFPNYYGRLYIPDAGIDVALYLDISQAVCDRWDSASFFDLYPYYGMIIADHCNQEFATLSSIYVGCPGMIVSKDGNITYIRCAESFYGHNTGDYIVDENYHDVMGQYDFLAYTCIDTWQNIWICQFETVSYGYESPYDFSFDDTSYEEDWYEEESDYVEVSYAGSSETYTEEPYREASQESEHISTSEVEPPESPAPTVIYSNSFRLASIVMK